MDKRYKKLSEWAPLDFISLHRAILTSFFLIVERQGPLKAFEETHLTTLCRKIRDIWNLPIHAQEDSRLCGEVLQAIHDQSQQQQESEKIQALEKGNDWLQKVAQTRPSYDLNAGGECLVISQPEKRVVSKIYTLNDDKTVGIALDEIQPLVNEQGRPMVGIVPRLGTRQEFIERQRLASRLEGFAVSRVALETDRLIVLEQPRLECGDISTQDIEDWIQAHHGIRIQSKLCPKPSKSNCFNSALGIDQAVVFDAQTENFFLLADVRPSNFGRAQNDRVLACDLIPKIFSPEDIVRIPALREAAQKILNNRYCHIFLDNKKRNPSKGASSHETLPFSRGRGSRYHEVLEGLEKKLNEPTLKRSSMEPASAPIFH